MKTYKHNKKSLVEKFGGKIPFAPTSKAVLYIKDNIMIGI